MTRLTTYETCALASLGLSLALLLLGCTDRSPISPVERGVIRGGVDSTARPDSVIGGKR